MTEARFYQPENGALRCQLCPHACLIPAGATGLCRARRNQGGVLLAESYGRISSMALDPIEKKPLLHFYPGSQILSVGSYGCNMCCPFCQNSAISQGFPATEAVSPEKLAQIAESCRGNLGVAFTYNEPLVGIEYLLDAAPLIRDAGLKTVLVTGGLIEKAPLLELLPYIDAMNIDVKGFTAAYYRKLGGDLDTVKRSVELCAASCHVEVTTLVVPGENDGGSEMEALSTWLASLSPDIPLHITRFFPRYKMTDGVPTPLPTLGRLAETAKRRLRYVHIGNV